MAVTPTAADVSRQPASSNSASPGTAVSPEKAFEQALTLAAMGLHEEATKALRDITSRVPDHAPALRKLAELLRLAGKDKAADRAGAAADKCPTDASKWRPTHDTRTPEQLEATEHNLHAQWSDKPPADRMQMLRKQLVENPIDAASTHMLSSLEWRNGDQITSQTLLERTLELSPFYQTARAEFARLLMEGACYMRALEQTTILLRHEPHNPEYRAMHSEALTSVRDFAGAVAMTEELLREFPRDPYAWLRFGNLLNYVGRGDDSARAYRTCLGISPTMGEAWWGLADLKGRFLTDADVTAMRARLADPALEPASRMYMYYALGHALERAGDFSASIAAYQKGARLFRGSFLGCGQAHDERTFVESLRSRQRVYTARNLARCAVPPAASPAVTPIFIVGMPRSGSTLLEQIFASHSQVEGTRELPLIGDITRDLVLSRRMIKRNAYPECVLELGPARLAALGERYLREARAYRKTERPWFVDKRPWNWMEAGLIHLILPHAKIIDIRREPMAACFAMFKQVLPDSDFSYDLHDLGRYYTEYAGLMKHWRSVMPGRIHFVQYERLVEDTENEIRRMLAYCGLPFEESCLRFWETERAVSTPSAEQVRRPIFRDALQQWRNFEPWLGPLREALNRPAEA